MKRVHIVLAQEKVGVGKEAYVALGSKPQYSG